jgi:hypothetical protein
MKKVLLAITYTIISSTMLVASPALALTVSPTTPSSSPSAQQSLNENLNKQINQLKERIASRVAELNLVEKRGIIGTVTETSADKITVIDLTGKTRIIDVDEITKFSSPSAKNSFGISDLTKGTTISALGLYNKQSQQILGRFIDAFVTPVFLSGRIADLDKKNYTVTVINEDQKQTVVDVQTFTTISTYFKDDGISKLGFSKLTIGDRIMVTGFPDKKDATLLVASRILTLLDLTKNPKIIVPEPSEEITASPTSAQKITTPTTSGKKLTPSPSK